MSFKKDLKKVMILYPEVLVKSSSDYRDLVNIHNIIEATFGSRLNPKLVIESFDNKDDYSLKTLNDYYYLIFKSAMENREIKKFSYPMMFGPQEGDQEFDIDKWSGLVHKIYDAVSSGDMNLPSAIDYYAGSLDLKTSEDEKFKKWIQYYQKGEHLKYSSDEEDNIKKNGFQFPLMGPGTYGPDNAIVPKNNPSFKKHDSKGEYIEWRSKLYSAIRRIDKLLRQSDDHIDKETHRDLADLLHHFDQEVRSLKHEVTASDLSFKYANKFKKAGFSKGHDELMKFSQDLSPGPLENREDVPEPISENIPDTISEDVLEPTLDDVPEPISEGISELTPDRNESEEVNESSLSKALSGGSQAREGEYEQLGGPITLTDAVIKLEEIAGRLSDRRTIRMLAEFDIMIDKIGIAAMFPELAEAQSKLIDGNSYALTRVTKMLGMLASGKSLIEISDAKKNELNSRTKKEVRKVFEPENEDETDRGAAAIQQGIEESKVSPVKQPDEPLV